MRVKVKIINTTTKNTSIMEGKINEALADITPEQLIKISTPITWNGKCIVFITYKTY